MHHGKFCSWTPIGTQLCEIVFSEYHILYERGPHNMTQALSLTYVPNQKVKSYIKMKMDTRTLTGPLERWHVVKRVRVGHDAGETHQSNHKVENMTRD